MELIDLARESASLEFEITDADVVREAMVFAFGPYTKSEAADGAILDFGGERFLLLTDWDDPCLIATSAAGVQMLRDLVQQITVPARVRSAAGRRSAINALGAGRVAGRKVSHADMPNHAESRRSAITNDS
jgi:hypothetical protein